ncbi:MAG: ATP synthase F1 subunit epsilon [Saccharofermentanales bacterium]
MVSFLLSVVTPEAIFIDEVVDLVVLPGYDGELGIQGMHEPAVVTLIPGELRYSKGKESHSCFISNGYAEVEKNFVVVVTNAAEWPEEIDVERARRGLNRARERLKDPNATEQELVIARHAVRRQQKRLDVVRRAQLQHPEIYRSRKGQGISRIPKLWQLDDQQPIPC